MSKFCLQCGAEIDDNTSFCDKCGAQQETESPMGADMNNMAPAGIPAVTENKSKLPLIIGASVVGVILLALVYFLFIRSSYADPIDKYFDAINDEDPKLMMECYYEDIIEEEYESGSYGLDYDEDWEDVFEENCESRIDSMLDNDDMEDIVGKHYSFSYDVLDKTAYDEDEIDDMIDYYDDYYEVDVEIEDAYNVCLRIDVEGDDDDYAYFTSMDVLKIEGEWYLEY